MTKKYVYVLLGLTVLVIFLIWLFIESSKPLPGTKIDDLGRGHVPIGEAVEYNSNPPTSGKHYEEWVRSGVYSESKDDRNLVHSLEHGYVILSYKTQKEQLEEIYNEKGKRKLIVVPRENLETNFALTAWNYLDKFNDFDAKRIEKFIDAHLNMGPEKTME